MAWRTKDLPSVPDSDLVEAFRNVQGFVKAGELVDAIELLQKVAENRDSEIARELSALQGQLSSVDDRELKGVETSANAGVERNRIRQYFLTCLEKLKQGAYPEKELRARRNYLDTFKKDITNRLNVSIHNARLMDLGLTDTPSAVRLPFMYRDTTTEQSFGNLDEAIDTYGRRLLVLGAPGSGKTVTLLYIAKKLIAEAERDLSAPVPMLANLSKLDLKASPQSVRWLVSRSPEQPMQDNKKIERWLQQELAANPFVSPDLAGRWIRDGRIATLLDGLDEVDDTYRANVAKLLNDTYLWDHPSSVVVICSRINEYKSIQENKEQRLNLGGSVTLQPFTDAQISEYLKDANAVGLKKALLNDDTLYQIARTPLMLSMLTLAYAGVEMDEVPSSGPPIERRHQLMERYVDRMLQRKMRRDRSIVVDNNPDNDVSVKEYPYSPDRLNHYLGWLAVRLSVRMQTAFSLDRLSSFLQREIGRDRWFGVWWAGAFARTPLLTILAIIAGLALAPMDTFAWQLVILLGFSSMLLYPLVAWSFRSRRADPEVSETPHPAYEIVRKGFLATIVLLTASGGLGVGAIALSLLLPEDIPPIVIATMGVCLTIFVLLLVSGAMDSSDAETKVFIVGTAVIIGLEVCWRYIDVPNATETDWYILAGILAGFQILFVAYQAAKEEAWWVGAIVLIVLAAIPFLLQPLFEFLKPLTWYQPVVLFLLVALLSLSIAQKPFLFLAGLVTAFLLGAATQREIGATLGMVTYGLVVAITSTAFVGYSRDDDSKPGFVGALKQTIMPRLVRAAEDFAERYWISPVLVPVLAIMGSFPFRFASFADYTIDSLLLKRSGPDIEFMHRLLRDYFALRDLQPLLGSSDIPVRLQAIRSLGFQGDAAIGALAEFARDSAAEVRGAAVWALGRIASPEIVQHIEARLADDVAEVRAAAVKSTRNMLEEDRNRLIASVVVDESFLVQRALVEWALQDDTLYHWLHVSSSGSVPEPLRMVMQNVELRTDLQNLLLELISDKHRSHYGIRTKAIRVAARLKGLNAVPILIEVMKERDSMIRHDAANALGQIGDKRALRVLMMAANDRSKSVRVAAQSALLQMGYPAVEGGRGWGLFRPSPPDAGGGSPP
jgi:HEAT repeat protein